MKYGLTAERWQAALDEIRDLCVDVACNGGTITYGELCAQLSVIHPHPGSYVFHALLRAVCESEEQAGRGLLCALVVNKETRMPGQGFFMMIARQRDCVDLVGCWQRELALLYHYWSGQKNRGEANS